MKNHPLGLLSKAPSRFAAVALALSLAIPTMAVAGDYRLGPQDKLNIRIAEWQTVDGTFRDWSSINGDYSVGPAGTLSV
ncbi:MAG: sugar ABC transporter substrate-binding protein, partial [Mesorhizobium sp.]